MKHVSAHTLHYTHTLKHTTDRLVNNGTFCLRGVYTCIYIPREREGMSSDEEEWTAQRGDRGRMKTWVSMSKPKSYVHTHANRIDPSSCVGWDANEPGHYTHSTIIHL
jgi:hypothetical protein